MRASFAPLPAGYFHDDDAQRAGSSADATPRCQNDAHLLRWASWRWATHARGTRRQRQLSFAAKAHARLAAIDWFRRRDTSADFSLLLRLRSAPALPASLPLYLEAAKILLAAILYILDAIVMQISITLHFTAFAHIRTPLIGCALHLQLTMRGRMRTFISFLCSLLSFPYAHMTMRYSL